MFKNNLKIAVRNLIKDKVFSVINIVGLALGIAASLLLLSWIRYELSFDTFHKKGENLYKVVTKYEYPNGKIRHFTQTPMPLAEYLRQTVPEVEDATIFWRRYWELQKNEKQFSIQGILTEQNFINMFTFPFVKGSKENLLSEPRSIAISQSLAQKLFGNEDPIGKTVTEIKRGAGDFTVAGVFEEVPVNSHMKFDYIAPFKLEFGGYNTDFNKWVQSDFETYALLKKGTSKSEFDTKIQGIIQEHLPESIRELYSVKVKDIHLNPDVWSLKQGSRSNIYIFSSVAFLVFLLACVNYINLTIARETRRRKEVGIMKVLGSDQKSLFVKFITETSLFFLFSISLSILLTYLFLPLMKRLTGSALTINLTDASTLGLIAFIFLITILVAGLYPSLHLSSLKPVTMLKQKITTKRSRFSGRKGLVLFQFSVFILLIIGLLFIYKQMNFIVNRDLGFDKDKVMRIGIPSGVSMRNWQSFRTEILQNPDIQAFTSTNSIPGRVETSTSSWDWEGKTGEDKIRLSIVGVFDDFIKTFGMKMKQGHFFSREFPSELEQGYVINEEAARVMGLEDPIGKNMQIGSGSGKIIGVIENYHFSSLREKIGPMAMLFGYGLDNCFIRINTGNIQSVVSHVEKVSNKFGPDDSFWYSFMDEELARLYTTEQQLVDTLKYFTILAIVIASLGLYGLALYNANQRTKEIAVRKVTGARILDIVYLLTRDSLQWVILANLIAWPLAFLGVRQWLQNFAYHTKLSVWPFITAALAAFLISLLIILYQTVKAARTNPVESLRYE
ncbi:MAG: ABC transporter permease [bacterium]